MAKYEIETTTTVYTDDAIGVWQEAHYRKDKGDEEWIGRVTGSANVQEALYRDASQGYYIVRWTKEEWNNREAPMGEAHLLGDAEAFEWLKKNSATCATLKEEPRGLGAFNPIETIPC